MNKTINKNNVIENETCFSVYKKYNISCEKTSCRCWFKSSDNLNCVNISTANGPERQEDIGNHFDLTRMRVCQIEKSILYKIRKAK